MSRSLSAAHKIGVTFEDFLHDDTLDSLDVSDAPFQPLSVDFDPSFAAAHAAYFPGAPETPLVESLFSPTSPATVLVNGDGELVTALTSSANGGGTSSGTTSI